MAEETAIQWADATLNLWWGCTKVSDGCKFCYAEHLSDTRYKKGAWGPKGSRREVKSWRSSLEKVSRRAKAEGRRLKVFCSSMSDVFEGPETCGGEDSDNWRLMRRLYDELWDVWENHSHLDFLVLTKRPENAAAWLQEICIPGNVWIGTSVENQEQADKRIPHLLRVDASVRFLSCEPLLGRVDLQYPCFNGADPLHSLEGIHWVICGGESGPNARPMHPDWARSLRDQCLLAGVPFFFKQWGEHTCFYDRDVEDPDWRRCDVVKSVTPNGQWLNLAGGSGFHGSRVVRMNRIGKHRAGRWLDGREWNEFPEV